jgi:hypothetical protein
MSSDILTDLSILLLNILMRLSILLVDVAKEATVVYKEPNNHTNKWEMHMKLSFQR